MRLLVRRRRKPVSPPSSFLPAPSGHRQRMIGGARSCRRYRPWRRMPLLSRFTHRRHPLGVSGACLACLVTAARTVPGCPEGAQECPQAPEGCRGRPDFLWRVLPVFRRAPAGRCVRCRKHLAFLVSLPGQLAGTLRAPAIRMRPSGAIRMRPNHSRSRLRCPKGAGGGGAPGRCPKGAGRVPTSLFRLPPGPGNAESASDHNSADQNLRRIEQNQCLESIEAGF